VSDPIVVTAVFTPVEGAYDQLVDALSRAIAQVHEEEGCLLYAIHRDPDGRIIMLEKWESAELLDLHGSSAAVTQLGLELDGLVASPTVVTRLVPIPAGTVEQGQL
jgi:quinol monooxygenase YgiN